jgi:hypothetical protein
MLWDFLRAASLAITLPLAGVSVGCGQTDCSIAGPGWPNHVGPWPPGPMGRPGHAYLRMDSRGEIEFNGSRLGLYGEGKRVSATELNEIVGLMGSVRPTPYLVVDVSQNAPCERVRSLSRQLEQFQVCREGGCLEKSAWDNYQGSPSR